MSYFFFYFTKNFVDIMCVINAMKNFFVCSIGASRSALSKLRSSPDRMTSSCHAETMITSCHVSTEERETLMTKSLDPSILSETLVPKSGKQQNLENELRGNNLNILLSRLQTQHKSRM